MLRLGITPALLLLGAVVCLGQGFDAPESQSERDAKSSAQDQVYNEYLKQQLAKGLVSREEFQKQSDYHAGWRVGGQSGRTLPTLRFTTRPTNAH